MTPDQYIVQLQLQGRHKEAQEIANRVVEMFREDPYSDGIPKDDGKCNDCGHVFTEEDTRYGEFEPFILCESCYCNRGGR